MDMNTLRSVVASAGANTHTIILSYIKQAEPRRGEYSQREVEPYSYRMKTNVGEVLYGFDYSRMDLRCFSLIGIESIQETQNVFNPRWVVEVAEGAGFQGEVTQPLQPPVEQGLTPEQMAALMPQPAAPPAAPTVPAAPPTTTTVPAAPTVQEGLTSEQMQALMNKINKGEA